MNKMIANLVPLLFRQISAMPLADKQKFVGFVYQCADRYCADDREGFSDLLTQTTLSDDQQVNLIDALWNDDSHH